MPDNYVLLEKVTLSASTATITFDNIPQTGYTDLKLVANSRTTTNATRGQIYLHFKTDTGSNYSYRRIIAYDGSNIASDTSSGTPSAAAFIPVPGANADASTFGNTEIYIPNYRGSAQKSYSADFASQNDSSTSWILGYGSALWTGTDAINQITISVSSGSFVANSTFYLYGLANANTTPTATPFATGGDKIESDGTYWIHTFLSSGTFTPIKALSCDLLVVAGGAGGGGSDSSGRTAGGGGGAGGYLEQTGRSVAVGSYNVLIGAGGAQGNSAAAATPSAVTRGFNGSNSIFAAVTAIGGGGGQGGGGTGAINGSPNTGGSGGGGAAGSVLFFDGAAATQGNSDGATGFGFAGGNGVVSGTGGYQAGAGGGGAGGVGGNSLSSSTASGGNGGIGGAGRQSSITGTATYYAAGGSGANEGSNASNTSTNSIGGAGGRGATSTNPTAGVANTGSGGGGGSYQGTGGTGGSGIVIIRYPIA